VLIDQTHKPWFVAALVILVVSAGVYIPYALTTPGGPKGGSALGLTYGIVGSGFMIYAGLLSARKKKPIWRVGRAQTWLRGHLWLGLISLPVILFHAGFAFGGLLTTILMVLFIIVVVSGIAGAALQHYLPLLMTTEVPMETIYEQIDGVRTKLHDEADRIVNSLCGPLGLVGTTPPPLLAPAAAGGPAPPSASQLSETVIAAPVGTPVLEVEEQAAIRLRDFYGNTVRPFLDDPQSKGSAIADGKRAEAVFAQLRTLLPPNFHDAVDDLENICEEQRQLVRQVKLHRWLHGWLFVHVPLSLALLLLGAVHAYMALKF